MEIAGIIILAIAVIATLGYIGWKLEKKKREAIAAWARMEGWDFFPEKRDEPNLSFSIFGQGHSRYSRYHLTRSIDEAVAGLDSADAEMFEYHYAVTTHSGKSSSTTHYRFTCVLLEPGLDLGNVLIRPEHWGDKIAGAIGFDDIDFEDAEFSKKFYVKAKDRRDAYDLIDQRMMRFLTMTRGWRIETAGRRCFIYKSGGPNAKKFDELARLLGRFLRAIPRTLVNEERERRGRPPAVDAGGAARHHREED